MKLSECKRKMRVVDRWWPWRAGYITSVRKGGVSIVWDDGAIQAYDGAHVQFLQEVR
jgi:hypothetical protein